MNLKTASYPSKWTAILLAGQRPEGDPLANAHGQDYKALIPIDGKSMLLRVCETLLAAPEIGNILILAQETDALSQGDMANIAQDTRINFHQSNNGIATSIADIAGTQNADWPILVTTADNPLLTTEMLSQFLSQVGDDDLAIAVVERQIMIDAYPDNKRTWLKFKGGAYSGANLFALQNHKTMPLLNFWSSIEQDRKKGWKIISSFGPYLMIRALLRSISFKDAMAKAGQKFSVHAKPISLDIAEAAIDVDKESDLALVREIITKRRKKSEQS